MHTKKIPEGDDYMYSTSDLGNAIHNWLTITPGITIISINTIFPSGRNALKQAAIITYTEKQKEKR